MKNSPNLTQSSLRNDPINRRMQGYSFRNFRRRRWSSRCKFFLFSRSKFDFKCSLEAEITYEHKETNGTRFNGVYKEYFRIERERVLRREEPFLNKTNLILNRRIQEFFAIDGCDDPSFRESVPPFVDRRIINRRSRCFDEEAL